MSRTGKQPIALPEGVKAEIGDGQIAIQGPKGALSMTIGASLRLEEKDRALHVIPKDDHRQTRALWGTNRSRIANMVKGVSEGFSRELVISGVGFRAQMQGKDLKLALGFSHDVVYKAPDGVELAVPRAGAVLVSGIDKQKVGQTAAEIRAWRKPEPYKGKGVAYAGEYIIRKEGKKK